MNGAPVYIRTLAARFDPSVFDARKRRLRLRLVVRGEGEWDALIEGDAVKISSSAGRADASLSASATTWRGLTRDVRGGMDAFRSGRLEVRSNLHAGIGFLVATSGARDPGRLRFRSLETASMRISIMEAGSGAPILAIHGLGATKGSFLPTVAALAPRFRVIALDLPGFGDSDKP